MNTRLTLSIDMETLLHGLPNYVNFNYYTMPMIIADYLEFLINAHYSVDSVDYNIVFAVIRNSLDKTVCLLEYEVDVMDTHSSNPTVLEAFSDIFNHNCLILDKTEYVECIIPIIEHITLTNKRRLQKVINLRDGRVRVHTYRYGELIRYVIMEK